jgi:hypothetical protein
MHTGRDRKRKVRIFETSRAFDTTQAKPLNNPRFLCRSLQDLPQLLKAALNALVADERTVYAQALNR